MGALQRPVGDGFVVLVFCVEVKMVPRTAEDGLVPCGRRVEGMYRGWQLTAPDAHIATR